MRPPRSLTKTALGAAFLALLLGCTGTGASATDASATSGGAAGSSSVDSIVFEPAGTLTLEPMQRAMLTVRLAPEGHHSVRFAISPDAAGSSTDASLNQADVFTDASGVAQVEVTAPTKATTFRVRATVGSLTAERGMSVSGSGFAKLLVTPAYSGKRKVSEWVVSVTGRMDCASRMQSPILDGDIIARAKASPVSVPLTLEAVPAGTKLAVLVRADRMATGCVEVLPLLPGKTENVSALASDLPLDFQTPSLLTSLAINSASQSFYDILAGDIGQAVQALHSIGDQDVDALLDVMQGLAAPDSAAFGAARRAKDWDGAVANLWGPSSSIHLRTLTSQWMSDGVKSLMEPEAFQGQLRAAADQPDQALFDLANVGQVDAARAGFSPSAAATWSADPGDTLLLGLNFFWRPSELVTALAERQAKLTWKTELFSDSLKKALSCTDMGTLLAPSSAAYANCSAGCLAKLCGDATAVLWDKARKASGMETRTLQINASAQALVDSDAHVSALSGSWLGVVGVAPAEITVGGPLEGRATAP